MSKQEVREFDEQFCKSVANQDVADLVSRYAPDAKLLPPNQPLVSGRAGLEEFFKTMIASGMRSLELDTTDVLEGGDLLVSIGAYRLGLQPPGGDPITDVGKYVAVFRRQADGGIKIAVDTFNSDAPAA